MASRPTSAAARSLAAVAALSLLAALAAGCATNADDGALPPVVPDDAPADADPVEGDPVEGDDQGAQAELPVGDTESVVFAQGRLELIHPASWSRPDAVNEGYDDRGFSGLMAAARTTESGDLSWPRVEINYFENPPFGPDEPLWADEVADDPVMIDGVAFDGGFRDVDGLRRALLRGFSEDGWVYEVIVSWYPESDEGYTLEQAASFVRVHGPGNDR